jgi:hypothetical protein
MLRRCMAATAYNEQVATGRMMEVVLSQPL